MTLENNDLTSDPQDLSTTAGEPGSTEESVYRRIHEVTSYVENLVASWNGPTTVVERRRWHRVPYHRPILVTPLHDETNEPIGPPQLLPGRDISLGGVSFAHHEPLSCKKVACTFDASSGCRDSVIVKLTWCRFTKEGSYQSGGQFVRSISLKRNPADSASPPEDANS